MDEQNVMTETNKLFIGNLDRSVKWFDLKEEFAKHGEVVFAKVATDRETRRSRGFGFVTFANEADAKNALEQLNGKEFHGRELRIDFARQQEDKAPMDGAEGAGHQEMPA